MGGGLVGEGLGDVGVVGVVFVDAVAGWVVGVVVVDDLGFVAVFF